MTKRLLFLFVLSITLVFGQTSSAPDFDFELQTNNTFTQWYSFGSADYEISADSLAAFNGKYSAAIAYTGTALDYKAIGYTLPHNYAGKTLKLSAYIKTENVKNGYAGLWVRIDPNIAIDNMSDSGITGTTEWKKYELTMPLSPENTTQIALGGLLVGSGKMWIDALQVTIDGIAIEKASIFEKEKLPADLDRSFDAGSGIFTIPTDSITLGNVQKLGFLWGFLKYYHPNVAKGQFNMDYELFRVLPAVLNAKSQTEFNSCLQNWVARFGSVPSGKNHASESADVKLEADLSWIDHSGFSGELIARLRDIQKAKRPSSHYYIDFYPFVGNPRFTNENAYSENAYPDTGFRLLALFRYWNMITYFFPYKYAIETDWKLVLKNFIPRMIEAKDQTTYTLAVKELIAQIHDSHAVILGQNTVLDNYYGTRYAVAKVGFYEGKAVVTSFYDEDFSEASGLKRGDVILKINDKSVDAIVQERLPITAASNVPTKLRNIAANLLRSNEKTMEVEVQRGQVVSKKELKTFFPNEIDVYKQRKEIDTCFKWVANGVAYLNNETVKRAYLRKIAKDLEKATALIIDLRNYPSDFPLAELSAYLLPKKFPFAKFTQGSLLFPGQFTFTKPEFVGNRNRNYFKGKVVLLVNELTQSAAEFHAMAYQTHPNATIVGSTTAGADGNTSNLSLPGGLFTSITGIGVYYPDGRETQRVGIIPDWEVVPTIEGISQGRDEVLEKALSICLEK